MTLLELLNVETGAPVETLMRIIATAPRRYKVYEIPKRTGGTRIIAHPARELKIIQRVVLRSILDRIPVSEAATAYVKDRGILFNARAHVGERWILKLDFRNFFPSIQPRDWDRVVRRTQALGPYGKDASVFHKVLFWGRGEANPRCLSIGAPTSPSVSNLVCFRLDEWMIEQAKTIDVRVTRYADDITVSGDSIAKLLRFERGITRLLRANRGVKLTLNEAKRGLYGPGERRMVTGLVLTPDGQISIGRDRKREISALLHRFSLGALDEISLMRTRGLIAFANSIEPNFVGRMFEKYGEPTLTKLIRAKPDAEPTIADYEL